MKQQETQSPQGLCNDVSTLLSFAFLFFMPYWLCKEGRNFYTCPPAVGKKKSESLAPVYLSKTLRKVFMPDQ